MKKRLLGVVKQERKNDSKYANLAKKLKSILKKNNKLLRLPNIDKWSAELKCLCTRYGHNRVEKTIIWYGNNINRKYIPQVNSARSFVTKFVAISSAMKKIGDEVEITQQARHIQELSGNCIWPGDEKKDELKFIQLCIDNWYEFVNKLQKLALVRADARVLLRYLVNESSNHVVLQHLLHVHSIANSWSKWNGNLLAFTLDYKASKFTLIQSYCKYLGINWKRIEKELERI